MFNGRYVTWLEAEVLMLKQDLAAQRAENLMLVERLLRQHHVPPTRAEQRDESQWLDRQLRDGGDLFEEEAEVPEARKGT